MLRIFSHRSLSSNGFFKTALALCLSLPLAGRAQVSAPVGSVGNSPLSQLGIGELLPEGGTRQQALGEAGSAAASATDINLLNPANLYYNRQLNLEGVLRTGFKTASQGGTSLQSGRFTPLQLNMVLPIARPLTLAIGLRQHAAVDYTISSQGPIGSDGSPIYANYYTGGGSIAQAYLAAGLRLFEGFTIGGQANYWLGTTQRYTDLAVGTNALTREINSRVSDVQTKLGAAYRFNLGGKRIGFSLTGELPRTLRTRDEVIVRQYAATTTIISTDTLLRTTPGTLVAPRSLRLGLAYEHPQHYSFVLDLTRDYWRNTLPLGTSQQLLDGYRASAGVEWIPNINGQSYPSLVSYRAGFFAKQLPYELDGKRAADVGFTLGLGWPVIRKEARYTRPMINTNVTVGRRGGPTGNGSYRETYVNFTLGLVLNDSQWFVRYKVD